MFGRDRTMRKCLSIDSPKPDWQILIEFLLASLPSA
jgi:hypothetical protein